MLEHKKEKMERHISLMESERTGILWKSEKVGEKNLKSITHSQKKLSYCLTRIQNSVKALQALSDQIVMCDFF